MFKYEIIDGTTGLPIAGAHVDLPQEELDRILNEQLGHPQREPIPSGMLLDMDRHFELALSGHHLDNGQREMLCQALRLTYLLENPGQCVRSLPCY